MLFCGKFDRRQQKSLTTKPLIKGGNVMNFIARPARVFVLVLLCVFAISVMDHGDVRVAHAQAQRSSKNKVASVVESRRCHVKILTRTFNPTMQEAGPGVSHSRDLGSMDSEFEVWLNKNPGVEIIEFSQTQTEAVNSGYFSGNVTVVITMIYR